MELTLLPAILHAESKDVTQHLPRSCGNSEVGPSQPLLCELFIWHKTLNHPAETKKYRNMERMSRTLSQLEEERGN